MYGLQNLDWESLPICRADTTDPTSNLLTAFESSMNAAASSLADSDCVCPTDCEETAYEMKVNSLDLDVESLCSKAEEKRDTIAMRDWKGTNSILAYWANQMSLHHYNARLEAMKTLQVIA